MSKASKGASERVIADTEEKKERGRNGAMEEGCHRNLGCSSLRYTSLHCAFELLSEELKQAQRRNEFYRESDFPE